GPPIPERSSESEFGVRSSTNNVTRIARRIAQKDGLGLGLGLENENENENENEYSTTAEEPDESDSLFDSLLVARLEYHVSTLRTLNSEL
ncbi:MAG TPA: hypothetical protein VM534_07610, partial [Thermoanaerobaculia bacterium]|nr:hypothetical protein [Thermoanaerobaculia bacterium]